MTTTAAHHAEEERVQPLCLEHVAVTKLVHSIDQKIRLHNHIVRAMRAQNDEVNHQNAQYAMPRCAQQLT